MASWRRHCFGVSADASLEELGEIAGHYPEFRIDYYEGRVATQRGWGK